MLIDRYLVHAVIVGPVVSKPDFNIDSGGRIWLDENLGRVGNAKHGLQVFQGIEFWTI